MISWVVRNLLTAAVPRNPYATCPLHLGYVTQTSKMIVKFKLVPLMTHIANYSATAEKDDCL